MSVVSGLPSLEELGLDLHTVTMSPHRPRRHRSSSKPQQQQQHQPAGNKNKRRSSSGAKTARNTTRRKPRSKQHLIRKLVQNSSSSNSSSSSSTSGGGNGRQSTRRKPRSMLFQRATEDAVTGMGMEQPQQTFLTAVASGNVEQGGSNVHGNGSHGHQSSSNQMIHQRAGGKQGPNHPKVSVIRVQGEESYVKQIDTQAPMRSLGNWTTANTANNAETNIDEINHFIESELKVLQLSNHAYNNKTSEARLQVYRGAFLQVIESFPGYKPILAAIRGEYEAMLEKYKSACMLIPELQVQLGIQQELMQQKLQERDQEWQAKMSNGSTVMGERERQMVKLKRQLHRANLEKKSSSRALVVEQQQQQAQQQQLAAVQQGYASLETKCNELLEEKGVLEGQLAVLRSTQDTVQGRLQKQHEETSQLHLESVTMLREQLEREIAKTGQLARALTEEQRQHRQTKTLLATRQGEYQAVLTLYEQATDTRANTFLQHTPAAAQKAPAPELA